MTKYKERHKLKEAAERIAAANHLAADRLSPMTYPKSLREAFHNKAILVTGGTGSIGREIVSQVLEYQPRVVRVFSRNEYNQYQMRRDFGDRPDLRFLVGDVRERDRMLRACEDVEVVFHAGALKHVEICEYNPFEAVKTNVIGTQNVVEAALDYNMELVVGISTDKAVSPTNTMGATKLLGERVILSASQYKGDRRTRFCVIRFGNVLASRGSAIPLFIEQIRAGGPVTLTHRDTRRFFMSIPQAVELALKASLDARGGEIYILKMPVLLISDLIQALIRIYAPRFGHKVEDISVVEIGMLPGEKLFEALMTSEEALCATEHADYYKVEPLKSVDRTGQDPAPAGYDSAVEPLLSVDEIMDMLDNHGLVEVFLEALPGTRWSKHAAARFMSYTGDVYDTPPPIVRVAMTVACAFGAVLMLWQLFQVGFVISIILTIAGLILSVYLIWSVPRASQTALATVGYWAMLAGLALFLPFG